MMFGKNVLLPYLLNRRINKIDYMIFSHFDTDHCKALTYLMENIKVKNVIVSKQPSDSNNFKEFLNITKQKNINVIVIDKGDRVNIEKNLYFDILWPNSNNFISDNALNNNSIVCKLYYLNFSILFTGDIEEIAENKILDEYKDTNILKSSILKVAHHGSKTSTTTNFLEIVAPKIALIGVRKKQYIWASEPKYNRKIRKNRY